ncbi:MAG TPA: kelch repeat-containing protein [Polyangia bacterium]
MRRRPAVLLLLALVAAAAPGCTFDRGTLSLHLVHSPFTTVCDTCPQEDPLPDPAEAIAAGRTPEVTSLRVRVEGGGIGVIERTFPFSGRGAKAVLPEIEVGRGRVISVEGVGPTGVAFSRGATVPLDIQPGDNSITVYIGRVGRFSSTPGPMRAARAFHSAVVLADGRVLLIGGAAAIDRQHGDPFAVVDALGTAEVLDSTSATFDPTPLDCGVARPRDCLMHPRALATATVVAGGVLVAGGEDADGPLADAELLDPAARLFAPGGNLLGPRSRHAAAPVAVGAALFGGRAAGGLAADVSLFEGGRFRAGPAALGREAAAATLLADGRVLVTGGRDESGEVATAELFDGVAVTAAAPLAHPRAYHTASLLADGRVLILGGLAGGAALDTAEVIDPVAGTATEAEAVLLDRWAHAATTLGDGRILVTGGFGGGTFGGARREVEILDPAHLESSGAPLRGLAVTRMAAMSSGRAGHTASALSNGFVLIAGGVGPDNVALSTAEVLVMER